MTLAVASVRPAAITATTSPKPYGREDHQRQRVVQEAVAIAVLTALVSYLNIFMRYVIPWNI